MTDYSNSKLKSLFDQLGKLEGTVLGNHSYLTAIFVAMIGNKIPWFTREVKKNLFTVSILHDLDLVDTGLEKYEFKTVHEINALSNQEKEIIKNHTNSLSKKLSKIDVIPSDVVNIISKHHEGAGPNSYPQGLNSPQLSPPICLFIIAHQFAIELSNIAFNAEKVAQVFNVVKEQYSSNSYKPFLEILEKELSQ